MTDLQCCSLPHRSHHDAQATHQQILLSSLLLSLQWTETANVCTEQVLVEQLRHMCLAGEGGAGMGQWARGY